MTITAINDKGTLALEQHLEEMKKIKIIHKLVFKKMGYKQQVICKDPLTLEIDITSKYFQHVIRDRDMIQNVINALKENGAKKDRDYTIKIDKEER